MTSVGGGAGMLTVLDGRTGKQHSIEVSADGFINASALKRITAGGDGVGLRVYDPGYSVTAAACSSISHRAGPTGMPHYRGIPVNELLGRASFTEVAYLLIYGHLPTRDELAAYDQSITAHSYIPKQVQQVIYTMPSTTHPMTLMMAGFTALGACYLGQNPAVAGQGVYKSAEVQDQLIARVLGKVSTLAALVYHKVTGSYPTPPKASLSYAENFLYVVKADGNQDYCPDPQLVKVVEMLLVLLAEDGLCCSTAAVRHLASSGVDVFTAMAGGAGALAGINDGGELEAVLNMLQEIGTPDDVAAFLQQVKNGHKQLCGFGPGNQAARPLTEQMLEELAGLHTDDPLMQAGLALQADVASDEFFCAAQQQHPGPNFHTALVCRALGLPIQYCTVITAVARAAGWCAHWKESLLDPATKIARPQQDYRGHWVRHYESLSVRDPQSPDVPEGPTLVSPQVLEDPWSPEVPEDGRSMVPGQQVLIMSEASGTMGDRNSSSSSSTGGRAMGSDSSYYSTLGRAANGNASAAAAAAVGYVNRGSSSRVPRHRLDSATLRIPGWSLRVSGSSSSSSSSSSGDLLDQLGSVRVPDLVPPSATTATTTTAASNGGGDLTDAHHGSSDVCDQLGLVRVATSRTWGDTVASSSSSSSSGRAMATDSSYYSTLGRAANGHASAAVVGYVGSSSRVLRHKLDSATPRIPGWSLRMPGSSSSSSSSSGDVLDQLGSVRVTDLVPQSAVAATTTAAAGNSSSSSLTDVQPGSSSGSSDVCDQLGLVRVATSGFWGDTAASGSSSGSGTGSSTGLCDSEYYKLLQKACLLQAGDTDASKTNAAAGAAAAAVGCGNEGSTGTKSTPHSDSNYYKLLQQVLSAQNNNSNSPLNAASSSSSSSSSRLGLPGQHIMIRSDASAAVNDNNSSSGSRVNNSTDSMVKNSGDSKYYMVLQRAAAVHSTLPERVPPAAAASDSGKHDICGQIVRTDRYYLGTNSDGILLGHASPGDTVEVTAGSGSGSSNSSSTSKVFAVSDQPTYPHHSNACKRTVAGTNCQ